MQSVQIATNASVDDERHTRPHAEDVLRQIRRGEGAQVVSAYGAAHDRREGTRTVGWQIGGERVLVHAEREREVRERCLQPKAWQGEGRTVHTERSVKPLHRQSALFLKGGGGDAHLQLGRAEEERVGIELQLAQGDVVGVEAGGRDSRRLSVVVEPSAVPMELVHGIEVLEEIHVDLLCLAFTHEQGNGNGVAGGMEGKSGVVDTDVV